MIAQHLTSSMLSKCHNVRVLQGGCKRSHCPCCIPPHPNISLAPLPAYIALPHRLGRFHPTPSTSPLHLSPFFRLLLRLRASPFRPSPSLLCSPLYPDSSPFTLPPPLSHCLPPRFTLPPHPLTCHRRCTSGPWGCQMPGKWHLEGIQRACPPR